MKILIVSQFISPALSVASIRWTKMAKYLKKADETENTEIDILTDEKNFDGKIAELPRWKEDNLLKKDMQYFDQYFVIPPPRILLQAYRIRDKIRGLKASANNGGTENYQTAHERGYSFFLEIKNLMVISEGKRVLRKLPINNYDAVISSSGPLWTHKIASLIKKKNPGIIWLADYRDACFYELEPEIFKLYHKRVSVTYTKHADAILQVHDGIPIDTDKRIPRYLITNGYDHEDKQESLRSEKFIIAYTGTLQDDGRTDFGIIFRAINELVKAGEADPEQIKVVYAGRQGSIAEKYAEQNEGDKYFLNLGLISRTDAMDLQRKASILLQCSYNSAHFHMFWTGKMYEYMMSGKPIIYIVNGDIPNSLPNQYMGRLGGCCYETVRHDEMFEDMKRYIQKEYCEWKEKGIVYAEQDQEYVEQFAYRNIAKQVYRVITEKCKEGMNR